VFFLAIHSGPVDHKLIDLNYGKSLLQNILVPSNFMIFVIEIATAYNPLSIYNHNDICLTVTWALFIMKWV